MLTWHVGEESFRTLAMIVAPMTHSPIGGSDSQPSTVEFSTTPVSVLGGLVDYLIKCRVDVVGKLDLSYSGAAK